MCAFVWHFAELTRCCFFMKTYSCLVSFPNFVIVLISCRPILSVIILVMEKSDSRFAVARSPVRLQPELNSTRSISTINQYLRHSSCVKSGGGPVLNSQK